MSEHIITNNPYVNESPIYLQNALYLLSRSMLLYFMFVILTIRKGKTRPNKANINQRCIPMRTNAASRLDCMKISLWRGGAAPAGGAGEATQVNQLVIFACEHLHCVNHNTVCSVLNLKHIPGPPQKKTTKSMIKLAVVYGTQ